jgi:hypothetical protein
MKKLLLIIIVVFSVLPNAKSQTLPDIFEIIRAGVKKAIKAIDLKIQRLQNKTIWLQNAQKVLENKMSELKLTEISDWVNKQKDLYANYFDELWKVKNAVATYQRVKEIIQKQVQLAREYSRAYALFKKDKNFTPDEISYMHQVYTSILDESVKNIDQIQLVISAFVTQISDVKRLEIINQASDILEQNLSDLREFNQENIKVSLQRAKEKNDIDVVKRLYGLPD